MKADRKHKAWLPTSVVLLLLVSCGSMDEGDEAGETAGPDASSSQGVPPRSGKSSTGARGVDTPTRKDREVEVQPGTEPGGEQGDRIQGEPRRLDNGLTILPIVGGPEEIASLRLTVEAGIPLDPKGKSGLARLCASCLLDPSIDAEKGAALPARLAQISATLSLHMEGRRAGFEISGPRRHLLDMARILFELMTGEPPRQDLVRKKQEILLHELSQTRDQRLRLWQIQRCMGLFPPTPKEEEDQLASLQTGIVQLFYASYYRPQTALLSLEAADLVANELEGLETIMAPWKKEFEIPDPTPLGKVQPVNYTPWEGPGAELILILPDPDPAFVGHAAGEVTWQIACLDGYGGLIHDRLEAEGLGDLPVRVETHSFDRLRVRCLSFRVEATWIPKLMKTLGDAFAVLASEEPSSDLFRAGVRRARLAWDLRMGTPAGRIDTMDLAFLADRYAKLDQHVLESISKLRARDYPSSGAPWAHPRVLIRGPEEARPAGARLIPLPKEGARPVTVREKVQSLSLTTEEQVRLAAKAYALAQDSIAGADTLQAFGKVGYEAKARFVSSIPFSEVWSYDMAKGKVERRRTILSTEIRTFTTRDEKSGKVTVIEEVEGKQRTLDRGESDLFQIESVSQPHALLATMLRQKIQPTLGGRMKSGGRSFLVLDFELFGQKLRLFVDEINGLPRRLVYPEWRQGLRPRSVTLLYEAYDKDGRFQLPRRISKYVDGEFRGEFSLTYPRRDR